jgi:hypothetical protein
MEMQNFGYAAVAFLANAPALHFYRTHGGREVDFFFHAPQSLLAIEAKASAKAHLQDARALTDLLSKAPLPNLSRNARRLGLIVTQGQEIEPLAPHVWSIPFWRLFGPETA